MKKILFGVFDWGLGHATRDIPIIEELLKRKNNVDIISTGRALELLKKRFGNKCKYFNVRSISMPYPKHNFMAIRFVKISPKMLIDIKRARELSKEIIKNGGYDIILSDCRYDVYDKTNNSYLINHQIRIRAPILAEQILEKWLASRIKKYKFCIVPDFKENSLTGILSHKLRYIKENKIKYIGIISQLKKKNLKDNIDYFISISGPEPQRSIFEKKILAQVKKLDGNIVIALGKPEENKFKEEKRIKIYSFLDNKKQEEIMNNSKFIVTRSGYTTIMELVELEKKKVLLIPTPGQTEQEYLAMRYKRKHYFYSTDQNKMDLVEAIKKSKDFNGYTPKWKTEESIKNLIKIIGLNN